MKLIDAKRLLEGIDPEEFGNYSGISTEDADYFKLVLKEVKQSILSVKNSWNEIELSSFSEELSRDFNELQGIIDSRSVPESKVLIDFLFSITNTSGVIKLTSFSKSPPVSPVFSMKLIDAKRLLEGIDPEDFSGYSGISRKDADYFKLVWKEVKKSILSVKSSWDKIELSSFSEELSVGFNQLQSIVDNKSVPDSESFINLLMSLTNTSGLLKLNMLLPESSGVAPIDSPVSPSPEPIDTSRKHRGIVSRDETYDKDEVLSKKPVSFNYGASSERSGDMEVNIHDDMADRSITPKVGMSPDMLRHLMHVGGGSILEEFKATSVEPIGNNASRAMSNIIDWVGERDSRYKSIDTPDNQAQVDKMSIASEMQTELNPHNEFKIKDDDKNEVSFRKEGNRIKANARVSSLRDPKSGDKFIANILEVAAKVYLETGRNSIVIRRLEKSPDIAVKFLEAAAALAHEQNISLKVKFDAPTLSALMKNEETKSHLDSLAQKYPNYRDKIESLVSVDGGMTENYTSRPGHKRGL